VFFYSYLGASYSFNKTKFIYIKKIDFVNFYTNVCLLLSSDYLHFLFPSPLSLSLSLSLSIFFSFVRDGVVKKWWAGIL